MKKQKDSCEQAPKPEIRCEDCNITCSFPITGWHSCGDFAPIKKSCENCFHVCEEGVLRDECLANNYSLWSLAETVFGKDTPEVRKIEQTLIKIKSKNITQEATIIIENGKFKMCDFFVDLSGNSIPDWEFVHFLSGKILEIDSQAKKS